MKYVPTRIRLPVELERWLQTYADRNGITRTRLITWVLQQFREASEKQK